jgi:hypothetical protein
MNPIKRVGVFVGGVFLNLLLLALAGALLERQFDLRGHLLAAQRSGVVSNDLEGAFRAKDVWADLVAVPIIGCLIGVYAAFVQKKTPALLAVACLLPISVYEIATEPVGRWSRLVDMRYFGMRVVEFLLAIAVAALLRRFLDRRPSLP